MESATNNTRNIWLQTMKHIFEPVLSGFANRSIRDTFTFQFSPYEPKHKWNQDRALVELLCRTVLSICTWFNCDSKLLTIEETKLQDEYFNLTIQSISHAFDGYLKFHTMYDQILVEMANLALAFFRCPRIWFSLSENVKTNVLSTMKMAAQYQPHSNNWLLFACAVDIFLFKCGVSKDLQRCLRCLNIIEGFYVGDGWYSDGPSFHMDYYNSFVIHPFLVDIYYQLMMILLLTLFLNLHLF
jgi:hypothetical protein